MPNRDSHLPSQEIPRREAGEPDDPHKRRGPPQRLEDTNASGDALNDTGEDNQRQKEEP
jgi:hypothetical protein